MIIIQILKIAASDKTQTLNVVLHIKNKAVFFMHTFSLKTLVNRSTGGEGGVDFVSGGGVVENH